MKEKPDYTEEEYEYICMDCETGFKVDARGMPLIGEYGFLRDHTPRCVLCRSESVKLYHWKDDVTEEGNPCKRGYPVEH